MTRDATVARLAVHPSGADRADRPVSWTLAAVAAGLVIGIAASVSVVLAFGLAAALVAAVAAAIRPALLLFALAALVFADAVLPSGLVVALLLAGLLELAFGRARLALEAPFAWAIAFLAWAFASAAWTVDLGLAGTQLQGLAFAACVLVATTLLLGRRSDVRLFLWAFSTVAVVAAVVGIASSASGDGGRAEGFAGDPNIFALYEVVALPLMFALVAGTRDGRVRTALQLGIVVVVGAILVSVSRGGAIALAVVVALLLVTPARTLYRSRHHKAVVVLVALLGLAGAGATVLDDFAARAADDEIAVGSGRVNEWRSALTGFREHPVVGLGYGGYFAASNRLLRATPGVDLRRFRLTSAGQRVHSAYIGTAAEFGLVGFALFAGMLAAAALALRRTAVRARRAADPLLAQAATALLIGLAGFAVASAFLSTEGSFVLFALVGASAALARVTPRPAARRAEHRRLPEPQRPKRPLRPRVAVVIPCFDDGRFVIEAVASAQRQERCEVVVVDDGSDDADTLEILDGLEFTGVQILRQANAGLSAARTAGVAATSAPYVHPLDADDRLPWGALGRLADALEARPSAQAAWGDIETFGTRRCRYPGARSLDPWRITYLAEVPGVALVRRTAIEDVGAWDMGSGYEDWDFWMKGAERGWDTAYVAATMLHYREHPITRMYHASRTRHEELLARLAARHTALFAARGENRRRSASRRPVKLGWPLVDAAPGLSGLDKERLMIVIRDSAEPWMRSDCARSAPVRVARHLRTRMKRPSAP